MTDKKIQSMTGDILFIQILEVKPWKKTELNSYQHACELIKEYIDKGYTNPWKAKLTDFQRALLFVFKSHSTSPHALHKYIIFNDDEKVFYVGERAEK